MKNEQLLEALAEAIKSKRRYGPNFPTPWDLSLITWDNETNRISLDLQENGKTVKYDLYLYSVLEHGELDKETSCDTVD